MAATGNVVQGNYIGTNAAGDAGINNTGGIVVDRTTGTTIGGAAPGAGNLISGNIGHGIQIDLLATGTVVRGNAIGTNAAGTAALPNTSSGVQIWGPNTTIGGSEPGEGNVISGNGYGLRVQADHVRVEGNLIGVTTSGGALGNGAAGVLLITTAAHDNTIGGTATGAGNTIAHNGTDGVTVITSTANAIQGNSIHSNGGLGIDLDDDGITANDTGDTDTGPNQRQNHPVPTSATSDGVTSDVGGSVDSAPSTSYRVELFSSPVCDATGKGEGRTFLGSVDVTTDGAGTATFNTALGAGMSSPDVVTATATDPSGNTSEFSTCWPVTDVPSSAALAVNTVADHAVDGCAPLAGGDCTLREAITAANTTVDADTITFAIPGAGVQTIRPTSDLPFITQPVVIDATSQPAYAGTPLIELDGSLDTGSGIGLWAFSPVTVQGFAINRFSNRAVLLDSGSSGSTIRANYIGTTADGTAQAGTFSFNALELRSSNNLVGGTTAADRNVIGGMLRVGPHGGVAATGNVVQGNYIGTNAAGDAGINNTGGIVVDRTTGTTIGGAAPGTGNLISGNIGHGIQIDLLATGTVVRGNAIGTNAAGTAALPNTSSGVQIWGPNTTIGGSEPGEGNVISGNGYGLPRPGRSRAGRGQPHRRHHIRWRPRQQARQEYCSSRPLRTTTPSAGQPPARATRSHTTARTVSR